MTSQSVLRGLKKKMDGVDRSTGLVITRSDHATCTAVNRRRRGYGFLGGKQSEVSDAEGLGSNPFDSRTFEPETSYPVGASNC